MRCSQGSGDACRRKRTAETAWLGEILYPDESGVAWEVERCEATQDRCTWHARRPRQVFSRSGAFRARAAHNAACSVDRNGAALQTVAASRLAVVPIADIPSLPPSHQTIRPTAALVRRGVTRCKSVAALTAANTADAHLQACLSLNATPSEVIAPRPQKAPPHACSGRRNGMDLGGLGDDFAQELDAAEDAVRPPQLVARRR